MKPVNATILGVKRSLFNNNYDSHAGNDAKKPKIESV